jgi:hypothetical protein
MSRPIRCLGEARHLALKLLLACATPLIEGSIFMRCTESGLWAVALVGVFGVATAPAQCPPLAWRALQPEPITNMALVYDEARSELVRVWGWPYGCGNCARNETWTFDGTTWVNRNAPTPGTAQYAAGVYDSLRQRVVVFGTSQFASGLYAWNGSSWSTLNVNQFNNRNNVSLTYDSARDRVVLFGGVIGAGGGVFGDTREFDGSTWALMSTSGPAARSSAAMAYDPILQRTVLYGGHSVNQTPFNDTWEWNGATWTQMNTAGPGIGPNGRAAFDASRGRVVLHGGINSAGTWEWTGSAWAAVPTNPQLERIGHGLAYDSANARLVAHAGSQNNFPNADTLALTGNVWSELVPSMPRAKVAAAMAFDAARGQGVFFGGFDRSVTNQPRSNETWLWNGLGWSRGPTGPSARARPAMTYDSIRQRVILHGGDIGADETWEWDGSVWTRRANGPGRSFHSIAFDPIRGRTVLHSGQGLGDTWEYDGTTWQLVSTTPPGGTARFTAKVAFSPARGKVILFGGGFQNGTHPTDTWEWNGATWAQIATTGPAGRSDHWMVTETATGRVIVGGGRNGFTGAYTNDVWAFDGTTWTQLGGTPGQMRESSVAYDSVRGALVAFGGETDPIASNTFTLPLPVAPSFTTHPLAAWAFVGGGISLSVEAAGVPAPTIQWRKNGMAIPGATGPTLNINSATPQDAGVYDCVATNACGSTTSLAARVAVTDSVPTYAHEGCTDPIDEAWTPSIRGDAFAEPVCDDGGVAAWRVGSPNESFDNAFYFEDLAACEAGRGELSHVYRVQVKASTTVGIPGGTFVEYQDGPPGRRMQILIGSRGNNTVFLFRTAQDCPGSPPACAGIEVTRPGLGYHTIEWIYAGDAADVFIGGELAIRGYQGWPVGASVASLVDWGNSQRRTPGEGRFAYVRWYTPPAADCGDCPPLIRTQPAPVVTCPEQAVRLRVDAANGPLTYRWRRNGVDVVNGPGGASPGGGTVEGASAATLIIQDVRPSDSGSYDAVVTSACSAVSTTPATLSICLSDWNCDGAVDFNDLLEYLNDYNTSAPRADLNGDGTIDFNDLLEFLNLYNTPC